AVLGVLTLGGEASDRRLPGGNAKPANLPTAETKMPAGSRRSDDSREMRLSPLVKRLVAEHQLDVATIAGTGRNGRVTHEDVAQHIARGPAKPVAKST